MATAEDAEQAILDLVGGGEACMPPFGRERNPVVRAAYQPRDTQPGAGADHQAWRGRIATTFGELLTDGQTFAGLDVGHAQRHGGEIIQALEALKPQ